MQPRPVNSRRVRPGPPASIATQVFFYFQAVFDIQRNLHKLKSKPSFRIGVARGSLFCGSTGGSLRAHYTAIGRAVLVAARLAEAAPPRGIFCDVAVSESVVGEVRFASSPTLLQLKGIGEMLAYTPFPCVRMHTDVASPTRPAPDHSKVLGRLSERLDHVWRAEAMLLRDHAMLTEILECARQKQKHVQFGDALFIVEARESGLGRTRLLGEWEATLTSLCSETLSVYNVDCQKVLFLFGLLPAVLMK